MQIVIDIDEGEYQRTMRHYKQFPRDLSRYERRIINGTPLSKLHGRWIPVSERLPEIGQNVLIDTVGFGLLTGKYENTKYGDIEEGRFLTYYSLGSLKIVSVEVIAWMPLPEPYK